MTVHRVCFWGAVAGVSLLANWGIAQVAAKHPTVARFTSPFQGGGVS